MPPLRRTRDDSYLGNGLIANVTTKLTNLHHDVNACNLRNVGRHGVLDGFLDHKYVLYDCSELPCRLLHNCGIRAQSQSSIGDI